MIFLIGTAEKRLSIYYTSKLDANLLQKVGLKQMTIHNFNDFSSLNYEANWEKVNQIYEEERKITKSFFSNLLNQKIND